jgi:hypothetical protein
VDFHALQFGYRQVEFDVLADTRDIGDPAGLRQAAVDPPDCEPAHRQMPFEPKTRLPADQLPGGKSESAKDVAFSEWHFIVILSAHARFSPPPAP